MARGFHVDARGCVVPASLTGAIDIVFGGQRVWSFSVSHDGRPVQDHSREREAGEPLRRIPWPKVLRPRLEGTADVELVEHATGTVLHAQAVRFGESTEPVRIVDDEGHPLAVDKGGRLQRDFSNTGESAREEIMDALEKVTRDLTEECGLDTYLMYGCLLGAVREGRMIGHDSDADVAYLSRSTHPFDIIRECTRAIRRMRALGWKVVRMSGANFKVWVPLPDGRRCGIDVFGTFHIGDSFYATASLKGTLDRSALLPFGTVTLEGREIVAPHRPEEVLEFAYGPGWRVPDPAFHFDLDPDGVRRMREWFRTSRKRMRLWHDFYKSPDFHRVPSTPSLFAEWVDTRLDRGSHVLDIGAGTGRDAAFLASRGHRVAAFDFTRRGLDRARPDRARQGVKVAVRTLNLEDLRAVLVTGARFAHRPGVQQVYARGLLDALGADRAGQLLAVRLDGAAPRRRDVRRVPLATEPAGEHVLRRTRADLRAPRGRPGGGGVLRWHGGARGAGPRPRSAGQREPA